MKTRAQKFNINQIYMFWTGVALIGVFSFMYIYFINITIFHTAERSNIEESITDIKSQISQLELELIDGTRELTINYAYTLGFNDIDEPTFVKRDHNTRLSLNEQ